MTGHFTVKGVKYPMTQITIEDMNKLQDDERTCYLVAYPWHFDELRRVWPKHPDVTVEFIL